MEECRTFPGVASALDDRLRPSADGSNETTSRKLTHFGPPPFSRPMVPGNSAANHGFSFARNYQLPQKPSQTHTEPYSGSDDVSNQQDVDVKRNDSLGYGQVRIEDAAIPQLFKNPIAVMEAEGDILSGFRSIDHAVGDSGGCGTQIGHVEVDKSTGLAANGILVEHGPPSKLRDQSPIDTRTSPENDVEKLFKRNHIETSRRGSVNNATSNSEVFKNDRSGLLNEPNMFQQRQSDRLIDPDSQDWLKRSMLHNGLRATSGKCLSTEHGRRSKATVPSHDISSRYESRGHAISAKSANDDGTGMTAHDSYIPVQKGSSTLNNPNFNDFLHLAAFTHRQSEEQLCAKFAVEREQLNASYQSAVDSKYKLQVELEKLTETNQRLTSTSNKQSAKIALYEARVGKFSSFLDGLGNDIRGLRKDSVEVRKTSDRLYQAGVVRTQELESLQDTYRTCAESTTDLKSRAMKALADTETELQAAKLRANHLNEQLSEKKGLLSEEHDRRSTLEQQLERQIAIGSAMEKRVESTIEKGYNGIIKVITTTLGGLEENAASKDNFQMTETTLATVKRLETRAGTTEEDIADTKVRINELAERCTAYFNNVSNTPSCTQVDSTKLQANLDETLRGLRVDLDTRENLLVEDRKDREDLVLLQEKLAASNTNVSKIETQLASIKSSESRLKDQNTELEARVVSLQSDLCVSGKIQSQLHEMTAQLNDKSNTIASLQEALLGKTEKMQQVNALNESLENQVRTLQKNTRDIRNEIAQKSPEHEKLQSKHQKDIEQVRREVAAHIETFEREIISKSENETKKLVSEKSRLNEEIMLLTKEVSDDKAQILYLQHRLSEQGTSLVKGSHEVQNNMALKGQENSSLQASSISLKSPTNYISEATEKHAQLHVQLNLEFQRAERLSEERTNLLGQIGDLQRSVEEAEAASVRVESERDAYRSMMEDKMMTLTTQLMEAQDATKRSEAELNHLRVGCSDTIDKEQTENQLLVRTLQDRLLETEEELRKMRSEQTFRLQVQQSLPMEQQKFHESGNETFHQAQDDEACVEGVSTPNENFPKPSETTVSEAFTKDCHKLRVLVSTTPDEISLQQLSTDKPSEILRSAEPSTFQINATPPAHFGSTVVPTKPRKKADRNSNAIVLEENVNAFDENVLPSSYKSLSNCSGNYSFTVDVGETQYISHTAAKKKSNTAKSQATTVALDGSPDFDAIEWLDEEILRNLAQASAGSRTTENFNIPSTHQRSRSLHDTGDGSITQGFATPSFDDQLSFDINEKVREEGLDFESGQEPGLNIQSGTSLFDARIDYGPQNGLQSPHKKESHKVKQGISSSQAEREDYTLKKPAATPNSASKLVHRKPVERGAHKSDTTQKEKDHHGSGVRSSSPDFVRPYNRRNPRNYRRPSTVGVEKLQESHNVTCRPIGCSEPFQVMVPQKRNAEALNETDTGLSKQNRRHSNRRQEGDEMSNKNDGSYTMNRAIIASLPSPPAPDSSIADTTKPASMRKRNLSGGVYRSLRRSKKTAKRNAFNERFSQELAANKR